MKRTSGKYTRSHTTIIEAAAPLVDFANSNASISKITLGIIKALPTSRGGVSKRIKCTKEPACLFVKIRGNRAIQEIRFFSSELDQFERELKKYANLQGFEIS